jgi:phospholipase/lecithinase/hemolysin
MNHKHAVKAVTLILAAAGAALLAQAPAPSSSSFTEERLAGFTYRALGPYRAGSWIADIAVPESPTKSHLYTFYVAVRYGGVWKTTNNGTTFEPVFDGQDVTGIGCLAVAPSNENIVWVGTGDLAANGASGDPAHRPHRHPPDEPGGRLRGRDGPAVVAEPGARRVQDD